MHQTSYCKETLIRYLIINNYRRLIHKNNIDKGQRSAKSKIFMKEVECYACVGVEIQEGDNVDFGNILFATRS